MVTGDEGREAASSPPPARGRRLEDRLIQLSLDIEDCDRQAHLLRRADREREEAGEARRAEEAERLRERLRADRDELKRHHSDLLGACDRAVEGKRRLAAAIEELLRTNKEEEHATAQALERIRAETLESINGAREAWAGGEEERRERWAAGRAERARESTARALEPELRRLVRRHRAELANLREEADAKRAHTAEEVGGLGEARLVRHREDAERRLSRRAEEVRAEWEGRVSAARERQVGRVAELRDRLHADGESHRRREAEEARRMGEQHATELSRIRTDGADRIREARIEWDKEKALLKERDKIAYADLTVASAKAKSAWESQKQDELRRERSSLVEAEKKRLQEMRDAAIDGLIRKMQREQLERERSYLLTVERRRTERTAKVREEIRKLEDLLTNSVACIERLQSEKGWHSDEEKKAQRTLEALEGEITETKDRQAKKAADMESMVLQVIEEQTQIKGDRCKRKRFLNSEIKMLQDRHEAELCNHRYLVDKLKSDHQRALDGLETSVRDSVAAKDSERNTLLQQIQDLKTRIKHTHTLLSRYNGNSKGSCQTKCPARGSKSMNVEVSLPPH